VTGPRAFAITAAGALAVAGSLVLAQRVTAIDPAASEISFVAKQMGAAAEGRFRRFSARLDFDPGAPAVAKAQVEVDLDSIDTGFEEADTEAKKKSWFDTQRFPTATFVSTSIRTLGSGRYEVVGTLSIKGRTREIVAPVSVGQRGGRSVFEGAFTLLRLDYAIGEGAWSDTDTVANEVQIRFRITGAEAR
jgi:polyisoprenoid-binding protein YceI